MRTRIIPGIIRRERKLGFEAAMGYNELGARRLEGAGNLIENSGQKIVSMKAMEPRAMG